MLLSLGGCSLLVRVKSLDVLRAAFKDYIKVSGLAIIMDEEKACPAPSRWADSHASSCELSKFQQGSPARGVDDWLACMTGASWH